MKGHPIINHLLAILGVIIPVLVIANPPTFILVRPDIAPFHLWWDIRPISYWVILATLAVTLGSLACCIGRGYALTNITVMFFITLYTLIGVWTYPSLFGALEGVPSTVGLLLNSVIYARRYDQKSIFLSKIRKTAS